MRNLSRIIFINSANIPYSDNIYLDGNIHFIGTQGVGKSTILRAILFFYNADTQKLGIPVEKQNYTDYYFPFANYNPQNHPDEFLKRNGSVFSEGLKRSGSILSKNE